MGNALYNRSQYYKGSFERILNLLNFRSFCMSCFNASVFGINNFVLDLQDILKQIKVKNLDTGEEMDLMEAEDQLPPTINPLSLHIMRLTSEYVR